MQNDSVLIFLHPLLKSPSVYSNWTETHLLVSLSLVLQFCFSFFFFKPPLCPFCFWARLCFPFLACPLSPSFQGTDLPMTCLLSHSPPALMDKFKFLSPAFSCSTHRSQTPLLLTFLLFCLFIRAYPVLQQRWEQPYIILNLYMLPDTRLQVSRDHDQGLTCFFFPTLGTLGQVAANVPETFI